jgi:predicted dehydrogenase
MFTRRQSIQSAALTILPARLLRGYAANEKLNLGIIGLAGMGSVDARTFNALGDNIAALCDVDVKVLERRGAPYPNAARYTDFRKMIEKERLDGVIVAVPDHNHAYISVFALRHGLHVYCQKPLCKSVHEARIMARVAAKTKRVTQMGTQSSAEARVLRTVEYIQSGAIGDVTEVHLTTDRPIWPQGHDRIPGEDPVPDGLDWDLWLGTAESRPYQSRWPDGHLAYNPVRKRQMAANGALYHPFSWRGWWDFGSGALGDIAAHSMNQIFLALDLGAPSSVDLVATSGMRPEMFPDWTTLRFNFLRKGKPPLSIFWYDGAQSLPSELQSDSANAAAKAAAESGVPLRGGQGGMVWIGTKGSYPAGRGPFRGKSAEAPPPPPERNWGREEVHKDWSVAIKSGKQAPCHFGYAGPFTEAYQLGNIALRSGHRVEWDPKAFRITNCREADRLLYRDYRKGWDLKEIAAL